MGSIRTLVGSGALFLDFRCAGKRCREYTALLDTPANRKRVEKVLATIEAEIAAGSFVYETYFPNSAANRSVAAAPSTQAGGATATTSAVEVASATPAFRAFAESWMRDHQVEWRRSHIKVLSSTVNGHLVPHFGAKPVGSITKTDILAFRTKLAALPGRAGKPGLSNKRLNGILAPLRQMLNEAAELHGFVSPMVTFKALRVRKTDVEPFTLDEVQSLLSTARADYQDYFTVRIFTGMRTGEIHGLKWEYIDFANRLILVRETFVLGEDEYTKTDGSQREIQMTQLVFDALTRQKASTGKLSDYVFCNREGKPLDNKNFTDRVWAPLLRHLGMKPRRAYQMRHTAATLWLASGEAPEWIARQLGHTSTEMLFRVYSRYVPNLTRRDGSAFERLLATRFSTGQLRQPANDASASREGSSAGTADAQPPAQAPPATARPVALMRLAA
jgi:integrase